MVLDSSSPLDSSGWLDDRQLGLSAMRDQKKKTFHVSQLVTKDSPELLLCLCFLSRTELNSVLGNARGRSPLSLLIFYRTLSLELGCRTVKTLCQGVGTAFIQEKQAVSRTF